MNTVPPVEVPAVPIWQPADEAPPVEYEMGKMAVAGEVDLSDFRRAMNAEE
jgi:hypothetical protein